MGKKIWKDTPWKDVNWPKSKSSHDRLAVLGLSSFEEVEALYRKFIAKVGSTINIEDHILVAREFFTKNGSTLTQCGATIGVCRERARQKMTQFTRIIWLALEEGLHGK